MGGSDSNGKLPYKGMSKEDTELWRRNQPSLFKAPKNQVVTVSTNIGSARIQGSLTSSTSDPEASDKPQGGFISDLLKGVMQDALFHGLMIINPILGTAVIATYYAYKLIKLKMNVDQLVSKYELTGRIDGGKLAAVATNVTELAINPIIENKVDGMMGQSAPLSITQGLIKELDTDIVTETATIGSEKIVNSFINLLFERYPTGYGTKS